MLLEIDDLALRYEAGPLVVEGLSLRLEAGEIGCLLGPSGCGKTSVLRAIAGFESPCAGEIRLGGECVAAAQRHVPPERRGVRVVFQDFALFPHLTVLENVAFGLRQLARGARHAAALEMLAVVRLPDLADRYPHELSGGQQQRVALARALVTRPRLILLDEPFSSLDTELREELAVEVRDILRSQGATALFVTHDQHESFALADRIGVMHSGHMVQWDTAYNLYHRPVSRFVADFVGQGVFISGRMAADGRVQTALGTPRSRAEHVLPPGTEVDVLLRPDDVVHDDGAPMKAVVVKKVFRGATILYTLRLPDGTEILSLVPSHHDHPLGEAIGVRLDAEHVVVFPR
ncbi:MAG TPA: ABC transporter ATP-binding protein [Gammaproteobacteria bacterium]|nr:ABC transporter ATP-binding protein [Gammaproteobacteria bacterium]